MELPDILGQLARMCSGDGNYCEYGCNEDGAESMIARAKETAPHIPYCTIADWVWVDINYSNQNDIERYRQQGLQPCFVRSVRVLDDEAKRPEINETVRTSALVEFSDNCLFRTRNTIYILVGKGSRVSVDVEVEVLRSMVDW